MTRVLVCGGRDYADREAVARELDGYRQQSGSHFAVIQGGASGADRLAYDWCARNFVECWNFPADWKQHGKAAGPLRNRTMLREGRPDVVLAFPRANGEWGSGTLNMIGLAEAAGVPVVRVPSPIRSEGA